MSTITDGQIAQPTRTISLGAFAASEETSTDAPATPLRVMTIGSDAAYLGFFTVDGYQIHSHWVKEAPGYASGYVHCQGDDCPACRAGMTINQHMLLPVLDRVTGEIRLLRISSARGPGKLLTELEKVLTLPSKETAIVKITRIDRYTHSVEITGETEHDPEAIRAVQRFKDDLESGAIDPTSCVTRMSREEMAGHPHIEKILKLQGSN